MSTNRRITDEQFSNDTAIDGSRIQKALDDTEDYFNSIPIQAIDERYSLNYMVFTATGPRVAFEDSTGTSIATSLVDGYFHHTPFLPEYHSTAPSVASTARSKGSDRFIDVNRSDQINPNIVFLDANSYTFTASVFFPKPVILDTVGLYMANKITAADSGTINVEATYPNKETDSKFQTLDGGRSLQRLRVLIDTDNSISSEDRTLNSKEYALKDFQELFYDPKAGAAPTAAMFPETAASTAGKWEYPNRGIYLAKSNINIPFHQMSRVRFRVVVYGPGGTGMNQLNKLTLIKPENFTFTVVYKERLIGG
jgi:hypothetical protein